MSAKVCPREPTPEMLKALGDGFSADDRDVMRGRAWDYWTTMYDAAPPQADGERCAMSMTDEQREALVSFAPGYAVMSAQKRAAIEAIFLAGLRMGRAEGREQAAKVCDDNGYKFAGQVADIIRALKDPT